MFHDVSDRFSLFQRLCTDLHDDESRHVCVRTDSGVCSWSKLSLDGETS